MTGISLILMDKIRPVMDGLVAIKHIREEKKFHKLPIIAITVNSKEDERKECISSGANDYLMKPLNINNMLSVMHRMLYH